MDNDEVARLCRQAVDVARRTGDFDAADKLLVQAARGCGLLEIPLVGFGEAGRILCADTARELLKERRRRGIAIQALPTGFDLADPYKQWEEQYRRPAVFLSHSHTDKYLVRALAKHLRACHIDVWVDEAEMRYGDSLIEKLSSALVSVDYVLAMISQASVNSQWVQKELDLAMNHEIKQKRVVVIPVLCDATELPGFLAGKYYANFSTPYRRRKGREQLAKEIIERWKKGRGA